MIKPLERAWTLDEFFAWQERQPELYELVNGFPVRLMAGAKAARDLIVTNIVGELRNKLRASGCRTFTGDFAAETFAGQIRRPDVGVDCGKWDLNDLKAVSPRLVVEVLSPSTRDFDSLYKLPEYQSIAVLEYILLVEPNRLEVRFWSRDIAREWREVQVTGKEESIVLSRLGTSLDMREIYDGIDFPAQARSANPD